MTYELAFKGATVVRTSGRARLHVYVDDGRIAALTTDELAADEVVDATGLHLLPGMVDTHVHLMDPGPTEREDFPTGTEAAACAGVTTIVEHTHGHPVREVDDLADKRAHLRDRAHVDYGLAAHVWPDRIDRIPALYEAGVTFFKIFTCSTHGVPGIDAAHLLGAFRALATCGAPALVHCEDETITAEAERILRAAGREDNGVIAEWRNLEAELVAVAVAGTLAALTGVTATIAHVSSPQVVRIIEQARTAGANLAAEACPQYFLLREQELLEHGAFRKFTPPMRARTDDDEQQLWRLLRDGVLTHVSTDHAPSTREQKTEGSIWDVHFGLPGLDTTLPMLLDAVSRGMLSLEDVARAYAQAPARRYGLAPRKGEIVVGADADVVLVDMDRSWTLSDAHVRSKAGWTPYAGRTVRGGVVGTWLRGRRLATDDGLQEGQLGAFVAGRGARG